MATCSYKSICVSRHHKLRIGRILLKQRAGNIINFYGMSIILQFIHFGHSTLVSQSTRQIHQVIRTVNNQKVKGKGMEYSSLKQSASSPSELTWHMESHNVTCRPAEVTFLPLCQWFQRTIITIPGVMYSSLAVGWANECLLPYTPSKHINDSSKTNLQLRVAAKKY